MQGVSLTMMMKVMPLPRLAVLPGRPVRGGTDPCIGGAKARMLGSDHVMAGRKVRHERKPACTAAGVQEQERAARTAAHPDYRHAFAKRQRVPAQDAAKQVQR